MIWRALLWLSVAASLGACSEREDRANYPKPSGPEAVYTHPPTPAEGNGRPAGMTEQEDREGKEMIALFLNLNSLLCAEVVEVRPLKMRSGVLEVRCIEYRGGSATKNYIVDTQNQTAFEQ